MAFAGWRCLEVRRAAKQDPKVTLMFWLSSNALSGLIS